MKIRWYILAIILGIMLGQALARRGDKKRGPDWERRYAELVEDVSRRTDQAKGKA